MKTFNIVITIIELIAVIGLLLHFLLVYTDNVTKATGVVSVVCVVMLASIQLMKLIRYIHTKKQ